MIFRRKVQHGLKLGRRLGFPTLNFHVGTFHRYYDFGVYACKVWVGSQEYRGALHFGPKFGTSQKSALEVHVLDFNHEVYGQWVQFLILKKVRGTKQFSDMTLLQKQIKEDIQKIIKLKAFNL